MRSNRKWIYSAACCVLALSLACNGLSMGSSGGVTPEIEEVEETQLTTTPEATISPINFTTVEEIVYSAEWMDQFDLFITDTGGSDPINLSQTSDMDEYYPQYSPSGKKIGYLTPNIFKEGAYDIWWMDADGTNPEVLVGGCSGYYAFSPNGRQLVFTIEVGEQIDIFQINLSGDQTPVRLTNTPEVEKWLSYSPDGLELIFTQGDSRGNQSDIFVLDIRRLEFRSLIVSDILEEQPVFSKNGENILFVIIGDGTQKNDSEIIIMNREDEEARQITNDDDMELFPVVSTNSGRLMYSQQINESRRWALVLTDINGENPEAILKSENEILHPSFNPRLKKIMVIQDDEEIANGDATPSGGEELLPTPTSEGDNPDDSNPSATEQANNDNPNLPSLTFWSDTPDMEALVTIYELVNPGIDIIFVYVDPNTYNEKLEAAMKSNTGPDIFIMDLGEMLTLKDQNYLLELNDLEGDVANTSLYNYVMELGRDSDGNLAALPTTLAPAAIFYRRDLAKDYFGTDDPRDVNDLVATIDLFTDTAKTVKSKSGGNTVMIASVTDLMMGFLWNKDDPWVESGTVEADAVMQEYIDTAVLFWNNRYAGHLERESSEWYASFSGKIEDDDGREKDVFCYYLTPWEFHNLLAISNISHLAGEFGIVPGPLPYDNGMTWVGVNAQASNKLKAQDFVRFVTLNEEHLKNWATGVYSNDFLTNLDYNLGPNISIPAGDVVPRTDVVNDILSSFQNTGDAAFLSGQNYYQVFGKIAGSMDGENLQKYDFFIAGIMQDPLISYLQGDLTEDEMWDEIYDSVHAAYPAIDVP